ncbi:MAG: GNAT family N-acetyltransferase [Thermoleophilia bacterium]|nr:GNAT family N-acetyltransferase [Thermoleophilia bacterium]
MREIPGTGAADVTSPYGYGGPAGRGEGESFYRAYGDWAAAEGIVTTFIRFHPLLENYRLAASFVMLERVADTASWRLSPDRDLRAGMHQMHRRGVRKAERLGVEVTIERSPGRRREFVSLYEQAMRRAGAAAYYIFPDGYWDALFALGETLVRLDARHEGRLLASQLHFASPPWLHYHLGAASDEGFATGASKLLFLRAAEWGREEGLAELHLGSGLGGREDSLWLSKQRFSPADKRPFFLGKLVHDRDRYTELTGGRTPTDGFFPAYRAGSPLGRTEALG